LEDAPTYAERRAQAVHIFGDIKENLGDRDGKRQRDCSDLSGVILTATLSQPEPPHRAQIGQ